MMSTALRARVRGVAVIAPGIAGWDDAVEILGGGRPWTPAPLAVPAAEFLPVAERRRVGRALRLALSCGRDAVAASGLAPAGIASVFASTDVDAENTHQICIALNETQPSLSPTRFHNSVQNAVSGYWTILTGSRAPTTMVMGADEIVALGLLEALSQAVEGPLPVLLVVFDLPMPAPLFATHPIEGGGALALVLDAGADCGPALTLQVIRKADGDRPGELPDTVADGLEALRRVHPVGKALPLLAQLAQLARPGQGAKGAQRAQAARQRPGGNPPTLLDLDRYHSLQVTIES